MCHLTVSRTRRFFAAGAAGSRLSWSPAHSRHCLAHRELSLAARCRLRSDVANDSYSKYPLSLFHGFRRVFLF